MIDLTDIHVDGPAGPLLRKTSLSLAAGERVGIVGESGSGKTLLALSMMGMVSDQLTVGGAISVEGRDMTNAVEADWRHLRARRLSMVFQEPMSALNPLRRVGDTVAAPLIRHQGYTREQARARALSLFEETGITDPERRLSQYPHQLSGGQRQRVLIALALACDPALLIADEPTSALDAEVALRITDLLVRLSRERNMALLFISHDLAAVSRTTERIIVMYGGDIMETGPTRAIMQAPHHPYTKGLLAARPKLWAPILSTHGKRRLPTIPGSVPPPQDLPRGCRFAGRCPVEMAHCATERPALIHTATGTAACHRQTADGAGGQS
ncbi:MAG: peptide ABC transporter ATP-binding protein [Rhodobacterales bacterium 34-62-10]|nr:MAG: peptide ABC transporter ATP-binding protein [Rhodobacterales bacterium 34-62-10]